MGWDAFWSAMRELYTTHQFGIVTADCQFCGAHYEFEPDTLGFEAAATGPGGAARAGGADAGASL